VGGTHLLAVTSLGALRPVVGHFFSGYYWRIFCFLELLTSQPPLVKTDPPIIRGGAERFHNIYIPSFMNFNIA
jgi:hypothetical protein